jgi:hypothetical protein
VLDQERHEGLSKGSSTEAVIAIDATDFLRKRINRKHPARGTGRRHSAVDHFNHGISADDAVPVDFADDSDTADHPPQLININAFRRSIPILCWRWLGFVGKGAQAGDLGLGFCKGRLLAEQFIAGVSSPKAQHYRVHGFPVLLGKPQRFGHFSRTAVLGCV